MNRIVLLAILALLAIGAYALFQHKQSSDDILEPSKKSHSSLNLWKHFEPKSGKFAVDLPGTPQHASDIVNDKDPTQLKRYEMFVTEGLDGSAYMINLITFVNLNDVKDKQAIYKDFIDDILATNPNNRLESSTNTNFEGLEAMDFVVHNDDVNINSKMFLDGTTLYVLSKVTKPSIDDNGEYDHFISSFKLNKNDDQKNKINK